MQSGFPAEHETWQYAPLLEVLAQMEATQVLASVTKTFCIAISTHMQQAMRQRTMAVLQAAKNIADPGALSTSGVSLSWPPRCCCWRKSSIFGALLLPVLSLLSWPPRRCRRESSVERYLCLYFPCSIGSTGTPPPPIVHRAGEHRDSNTNMKQECFVCRHWAAAREAERI